VMAFWLIIVMQNVDGDLQMLWLWEGIYWSRLIANAGLFFLDLEDNLGWSHKWRWQLFWHITWLVGVVMRQLYMCLALEKMNKKVTL
jgi:hypothetical protein